MFFFVGLRLVNTQAFVKILRVLVEKSILVGQMRHFLINMLFFFMIGRFFLLKSMFVSLKVRLFL